MNEDRFHQQADLIDAEVLAGKQFVIVGAGAIGSFFANTLAKMGAQDITIFDHDTIEDHNIANQLYPEYMIGQPKVGALKDVVKSYSGVDINAIQERFETQDINGADFFVSAVDNMDVRKILFDVAKKCKVKYFIDGRMGALMLRAYSIDMNNPEEVKSYEKTLYSQAKARSERCTAKSIIFTVLLVAGFMLDMVKKRINGETCPKEVIFDSTTNYYCRSITDEAIPEVEEDVEEAVA